MGATNNSASILSLEMIKGKDSHSAVNINTLQVKRVLICRPNHRLGNLLLITPLIQEISETFPDCKIDLFVKGNLAPILFKNYENIDAIIQLPKRPFPNLWKYFKSWISIKKRQYDIVIDADKRSSSGKLSVRLANSKFKITGDIIEYLQLKFNDYGHHAKYPVYNFRHYLTEYGLNKNDSRIPSLNLKLNFLEIADGKRLLNQLVQNHRKTICLFTYATGDKCYNESWWKEFYQRLQVEYPHFNIIEVLPIQNVSKLSFKAPSFYSKDIREIGSLIANTDVFVGADSGIMHLADSVQAPTVGLFSVTEPNLYRPYGNNSVAINTNHNGIDQLIEIISNLLQYKFIYQPDLRIIDWSVNEGTPH